MKSVLISIQPKWCELIASGKKTIEVRKTKPKIETPFKVYIYCTKDKNNIFFPPIKKPIFRHPNYVDDVRGNGKVIGEFVCDCIANYEAELWDDETFERIQEFYEPDDFAEYGEYEYKTIADNSDDFWKENMLCKSSCLTIEELRKYLGTGITEFYGWHISNLVIYDKPRELYNFQRPCNNDCEDCEYLDVAEVGAWEHTAIAKTCLNFITRPPQSWCYVEDWSDTE